MHSPIICFLLRFFSGFLALLFFGGMSIGYKVFVAYEYIFIEKLLHTKLLIVWGFFLVSFCFCFCLVFVFCCCLFWGGGGLDIKYLLFINVYSKKSKSKKQKQKTNNSWVYRKKNNKKQKQDKNKNKKKQGKIPKQLIVWCVEVSQ